MIEMSEREKFLFDLQGFLHVRDFLTTDEVSALNEAVDANVVPMEEYDYPGPSQYAGGMYGEFGVRSEMDIFLGEDGPEITGDRQMEIVHIETG